MEKKFSNLPAMLARACVDEVKSKDFLIYDGCRVGYTDIKEQIARTRAMFRAFDLSINKKLLIACSDKRLVAVLYISCLLDGVTAVIIDPDSSASELTLLLSRSEPALSILDQCLIDEAAHLQKEDVGLEVLPVRKIVNRNSFSLLLRRSTEKKENKGQSYPSILDNYSGVRDVLDLPETTPGLILFTSGTTSKPKGVVLTHLNLQSQLRVLISQFNLTSSARIANHLPLHHTDGLNQGPLLAAAVGGSWLSSSDVLTIPSLGNYLDTVYRERVTHFITVPTVLAMMNLMPEDYFDCFDSKEFQFIESTAGYLNESLWKSIESKFSVNIVNCYGLTETVVEASYCGPCDASRKVGTIGKPVGCEFKIVDQSGASVKEDEVGELWVRGDIVMDSYFNDEESTRKAFHCDWFKTGDLAICNNGFYSIVGRLNSTIIRGGTNIYPEDINNVLNDLSGIDAVATIGIQDEMLGEKVVCAVVVNQDHVSVDSIFSDCAKYMAKEKIPNEIHLLSSLPYGPSGKVDLKALKEALAKERDNLDITEGSSVVESVIEIASKVFHVSVTQLSVRSTLDNVKQWDSLAFLELVMSLEKAFLIKFPPKDIMRIRSLGDAVEIVENRLTHKGKLG